MFFFLQTDAPSRQGDDTKKDEPQKKIDKPKKRKRKTELERLMKN